MTRFAFNRLTAAAPIAMSLLGLCLVGVVVLTGWERSATDEGAAAHIFQLLIISQAPIVLSFLVTADWTRLRRNIGIVSLQAASMALAIGSVAFFRL